MTLVNLQLTLLLGLTGFFTSQWSTKCLCVPHAVLGSCQTKKSAMSMPAAFGPHCVYMWYSWVEASPVRSSIRSGGRGRNSDVLAVLLKQLQWWKVISESEEWGGHLLRPSPQFYLYSWSVVPRLLSLTTHLGQSSGIECHFSLKFLKMLISYCIVFP